MTASMQNIAYTGYFEIFRYHFCKLSEFFGKYLHCRPIAPRCLSLTALFHELKKNKLLQSVGPPGFCNRGKVRYGSKGGLQYEVPQSRL